jgi:activator of 2-hydroxyglutaryl-CoA dehydratase
MSIINDVSKHVSNHIGESGEITSKQVADELGLPTHKVTIAMRQLVVQRKIIKVGVTGKGKHMIAVYEWRDKRSNESMEAQSARRENKSPRAYRLMMEAGGSSFVDEFKNIRV